MCPDRQILSVYFDGELDSPWKEKLESHIEQCPSCRKRLTIYQLTRQSLAEDSGENSLEQAMERVWEKTTFTARPRRRFWTASVTIPIPAAAAAGLVMALALAAIITLRQPPQIHEPPQLAGMEMQEMIPVSEDMASVLQYLGSENSSNMVIIRLPDTTFDNVGEPRMIRAADYSRGNGSR